MVFGAALTLGFPDMFNEILTQKLKLLEGTPSYDVWKKNTDPMYLKIHMFHVLNPYQVANHKSKPHIKEMGPYVFRETNEKTDIRPFPQNSSVSYKIKRSWYFEPNLSNGSLSDNITSINLPVLASQESKRGNYWDSLALHLVYDNMQSELFVNRTVGQLLFEGYEDELLALAEMMGEKSRTPLDRFGYFYKRNETVWGEGEYNMFTGEDDYKKTGKIHTWDNKTRTHYQGHCGEIRGSANGFFPPFLEKNNTLELFSHEACRTFTYYNTGVRESIEDVAGYIYELPPTTFANESINPHNWCYENNLPSGVHNSSNCKDKKTPLFLSFPHFYGADHYFIDQLDKKSELKPEKDKHGSRMIIEKKMGIPIEFLLRLQINMRIHPNTDVTLMENVPEDLYLPVMWFEAIGQMSSKSAPTIRFLLKMPFIASIVGPVIIIFNLLIAVFLSFRIYQISQQKEFETVNNIEDMNELRSFHEKKDNDNSAEENAREPGCEMKLICNNCI